MEIKTLIVDDDEQSIEQLKTHLSSFTFVNVVGEVNGGKSAMSFMREEKVDLLFLDIEMDDINGLELAEHIQSLYSHLMIIFVTGHPGFALESFAFHPIDYLTKPIDFFRLEKTMHIVRDRKSHHAVQEPEQKIGMKVSGGIHILKVADIHYIEKKGRKILIVTNDKEPIYSSDSMKNLETIFSAYDFMRVHQSFIIPLQQIKAILPDDLTRSHKIQLDEGTMIPLSRKRYGALNEKLVEKGISIY